MALQPGEDIGAEAHASHDQFFRTETGVGTMVIESVSQAVKRGAWIVVPAGARHNLTNTGDAPMKLYTIYAPPTHRDHLSVSTNAEITPEQFNGVPTERPCQVPRPGRGAETVAGKALAG